MLIHFVARYKYEGHDEEKIDRVMDTHSIDGMIESFHNFTVQAEYRVIDLIEAVLPKAIDSLGVDGPVNQ